MIRNLDTTALRSFVSVADLGGVTRAASQLHLTQSAVSMQLKRLEEAIGVTLLDRSGRRMRPTPEGEQLLGYARRMLDLNDEALSRLTEDAHLSQITVGLPHDILYPAIPPVLSALARRYPKMRVHLRSETSGVLMGLFAAGDCDVILTTEDGRGEGSRTLVTLPLVWGGAVGGSAYRSRPLGFATSRNCSFSPIARTALDQAQIPWEAAVESGSDRVIEAIVMADLAVNVLLARMLPEGMAEVPQTAGLPRLPDQNVNLYMPSALPREVATTLEGLLADSYRQLLVPAAVD